MTSPQNHRLTVIAVAALVLALGAGCEKKTTTTGTAPSTTTPPATTSSTTTTPGTTSSTTTVTPAPSVDKAMTKAGDTLADAAITTKVKTAMLADSEVKGLQINVDTVGGVVTLTGTVDNKTNIDKAVSLTKGIEGVKSVENKLTAKSG